MATTKATTLAQKIADLGSDGQVLTSTGVGSAPAYEAVPAGFTLKAITHRLITTQTNDQNPLGSSTSDWEIADDMEYEGNMGTPVTQANGIFTFAETGHYLILLNIYCIVTGGGADWIAGGIDASDNGSGGSYQQIAAGSSGSFNADGHASFSATALADVTNISGSASVCKIAVTKSAATATWQHSTDTNKCAITFIKLGDTYT